MNKKKLLIMIDWFLPGYKAGGQIQSCANLALALQPQFDIHIITTDRDLGDAGPYSSVRVDQWNTLPEGLHVFYVSPANLRYAFLKEITRALHPDCIYLNSMFSWTFTVLPVLMYYGSHKKVKIVLAPRGMLHRGALLQKHFKKSLFLKAFTLGRLHRKVLFHATNKTEAEDILSVIGQGTKMKLVPDFNASVQQPYQAVTKNPGELQCLFVARIVQHKNLLLLLQLLLQVSGPRISLVVAGPVEEQSYWEACRQLIGDGAKNISVRYLGAVPHGELEKIYTASHLFILPTLGENFGHAIFESLLHGRPVLTSDKTPWHDLEEKKAGWTVSLHNPDGFLAVIRAAAAWTQHDFDEHAGAAWRYAADYIRHAGLANKYTDLFS